MRQFRWALAAPLLLAACTDLSSKDIRTNGIHANIRVSADGTGASNVVSTLNVGSNITDFVELEGGDAMTATVASSTQTLTEAKLLGAISYGTTFTGHDAPDTQYTVALNRTSADDSAPSSTCTVPQPFALTGPASGGNFSRATQDITVSYSGSGQPEPMSWSASGDCFVTATGSLPSDIGGFVIPKDTLKAASADGGSTQSCQGTVTVFRTRAGTLDKAYGGGSVACAQTRTFTFTSAP